MPFAEQAAIAPQEIARSLRARYDSGDPSATDDIKRQIALYPFYHDIEVVPGVSTRGLSAIGFGWADGLVKRIINEMEGLEFAGRRVLDIGCRDGALSFAAERLGAKEVVGIDNDLSKGLTEFLIPFRNSRVRATQCNVNDLTRDRFGEFDTVVFPGVLYHLRYPMWALRRIADILKPGGALLIEGGFINGFADLPVMFCPTLTGSPYEPTSVTFFNEAGMSATLESLGFHDIRCIATFGYTSRLRVARLLAREYPGFVRRYWWRLPRVCRKIFVCKKGWSDAATRSGGPDILARYWDGFHTAHTGG